MLLILKMAVQCGTLFFHVKTRVMHLRITVFIVRQQQEVTVSGERGTQPLTYFTLKPLVET